RHNRRLENKRSHDRQQRLLRQLHQLQLHQLRLRQQRPLPTQPPEKSQWLRRTLVLLKHRWLSAKNTTLTRKMMTSSAQYLSWCCPWSELSSVRLFLRALRFSGAASIASSCRFSLWLSPARWWELCTLCVPHVIPCL